MSFRMSILFQIVRHFAVHIIELLYDSVKIRKNNHGANINLFIHKAQAQ
jgi:hypothetical protein